MARELDILDDDMARILRDMTGAERLKIANDLFASARRMLASHLAAEHPDWDQDRIERETARRISHGFGAQLDFEEIWQEVRRRARTGEV